MRLLQCLPTMGPAGGGVAEVVRHLTAGLEAAGHEVEIATCDSGSDAWLKDAPPKLRALGPSYHSYRYSPRLVPWLKQNASRYDAIVVHGLWRYPSLAVWRALRKTGTSYVVFPHGMLSPWFSSAYPMKHLKKRLFWKLFEGKVTRDALALVFSCDEERRLAQGGFSPYAAAERIVAFGLSEPPGGRAAQTAELFGRFPDLKAGFLLFLGRLHAVKGIDNLIKGLGSASRLVIAGAGEAREERALRTLAVDLGVDSRITWTGNVEGDLKWGLLRHAEALVVPSHTENFSFSTVEALACGVPVLVSDKVNIADVIVKHRAGLVDADTVEGTVNLLRRWSGLRVEERVDLGQRARHCFEHCFEAGRFARRFIEVVSEGRGRVRAAAG